MMRACWSFRATHAPPLPAARSLCTVSSRFGLPSWGDHGAVPEGNLQIVRRGYEVINRGEVDRFLTGFVHAEYEFHTGVQVPSIPTIVCGRDALRAWIHRRALAIALVGVGSRGGP
jgi:hypothetical protein